VPPVALLLLLTTAGPRKRLRAQFPRATLFLACLVLLCAAHGGFWAYAVGVPFFRLVPEILLAAYFLTGAVLLTFAARVALRGLGGWLGNRGFGPSPAGQAGRVGRALVADALPPLLLGVLALAYLLGTLYVHRLKIPTRPPRRRPSGGPTRTLTS